MANMCLLIAVESSGCMGLGAEPRMTSLAFCEEDRCHDYVAELQRCCDYRLAMKNYVWVVPVPSSGTVDLESAADGYNIMLR